MITTRSSYGVRYRLLAAFALGASLGAPGASARAAEVAAWVLPSTGQPAVLGGIAPTFPALGAIGSPAAAIAAGGNAAIPVIAGRAGRVLGTDAGATDVGLERKERVVELLRSGTGAWVVTSRGRIVAIDTSGPTGASAALRGADTVVDAAGTPTGLGAWLLTKSGRVLSIGDAALVSGRVARGARAIAGDAAGAGFWVAPRKGRMRALLGAPELQTPRGRIVALASLLNVSGVLAADGKGQIWMLLPDRAPELLGRVREKVADVVAAPRLERAVVGIDAARAASATIGRGGGTIEATAASGAVVSLVVPPGALPEDRTITVTPVTSLDGVAASAGLIAAVDLQPSGLHFALPGHLAVTLPADAPSRLVALSWSGPDDRVEFPSWVRSADGRSATIEIRHFSGAGVVAASAAALELLAQQIAGDLPAVFAELAPQIVQTRLALDAARAEGPSAAPLVQEKLTLLRRHFADLHAEGVAPLLGLAEETMPGFLRASKAAFTFGSWLATIGDEDAGDEAVHLQADRDAIAAAARTLVLRYLTPRCDAPASILGDWLVHPLFLAASETMVADQTTLTELLAPATGEPPHCLRLVLHELDFPTQLEDERTVTLRLQPRYEVIAPGGVGTQRVENTTFEVFGDLQGAVAQGAAQLALTTDAAGRIAIELDRGEDPASRERSLTVSLLITPVAPPATSGDLPTIFDAPLGVAVQPGEAVPGQLLPITIARTLSVQSTCIFVGGGWSGTYAGGSVSGTWAASFGQAGTALGGNVSIDGGARTPLTGVVSCGGQITFGTVGGVTFDGVVTADGSCASGSWQAGDASGGWEGCRG